MRRLLLAALAALVVLLTGCGGQSGTATVESTAASQAASQGVSGLPTVALTELPAEAQQTYELVMEGGPFPYRQDDQVFGNREGVLPPEEYGWYREYTIPTPGSPDRGAQRFVVGDDDVFFYTDDHYDSFSEVIS